MRRHPWGVLALACAAFLAISAKSQMPAVRQETHFPTAGSSQRARLPYTAEFRTTRVQTLADGNTITHETTEVMARDSLGQTYNLNTTDSDFGDQTEHTSVNIYDPESHTQTAWFSPGRRVMVSSLQESGSARAPCAANIPAAATQTQQQRVKPTSEDLGKQTFLGVEARGRRTTFEYPAGSIGNSAPLVHTSEVWFSTSPGIEGINVSQVDDDPRTGKSTRELVKFSTGEPDTAMFQPPQDFEIVTHEMHDEVRCPQLETPRQ